LTRSRRPPGARDARLRTAAAAPILTAHGAAAAGPLSPATVHAVAKAPPSAVEVEPMMNRPTRREFLAAGGRALAALAAGDAVFRNLGAFGTAGADGLPGGMGSPALALAQAPAPWFRISLAQWSLHRTIRAGEL